MLSAFEDHPRHSPGRQVAQKGSFHQLAKPHNQGDRYPQGESPASEGVQDCGKRPTWPGGGMEIHEENGPTGIGRDPLYGVQEFELLPIFRVAVEAGLLGHGDSLGSPGTVQITLKVPGTRRQRRSVPGQPYEFPRKLSTAPLQLFQDLFERKDPCRFIPVKTAHAQKSGTGIRPPDTTKNPLQPGELSDEGICFRCQRGLLLPQLFFEELVGNGKELPLADQSDQAIFFHHRKAGQTLLPHDLDGIHGESVGGDGDRV